MTIEERERDFKNKVNLLIEFPYEMRQQFISYWTEPSAKGKMRFEYEKTWDLKRRLHRWAGQQQFKIGDKNYNPTMVAQKQPVIASDPEIAALDKVLDQYRRHPTEVPFTSLGKHYQYLKDNGLMKPFYKKEVEDIRDAFKGDVEKCRCACVEETLKYYGNKGWTFQMTMEARKRLEPVK